MPRTRICHIIHRLDYGGLENGLVNLINRLPHDRFDHAIVCLTGSTDFRDRIARSDVPVLEIGKRLGKDISAYARVWRALRHLRPDVVHTRNLPALDMLPVARAAGVRRLLHSEHGLDVLELDGQSRRYAWLRRATRPLVAHHITVSNDLANWLQSNVGVTQARISVIYNGVDVDRFSPTARSRDLLPDGFAPSGAFIIGHLGRLETIKNQTLLARAFCRILDLRPDLRESIRLVIVGEGRLQSEIESILSEADARDLAWLPGFRDDAPELYRAFDVFVLPSKREGISNTLLEAMASGLAVVATNVGGNAEVVNHGETGTLVPADDPDALAAALITYLEKPNLTRSQGEAGRARAEKEFSLAAMVQSYESLYRSL